MAEEDGQQQHGSNVFAEYIIETKLQFWQGESINDLEWPNVY